MQWRMLIHIQRLVQSCVNIFVNIIFSCVYKSAMHYVPIIGISLTSHAFNDGSNGPMNRRWSSIHALMIGSCSLFSYILQKSLLTSFDSLIENNIDCNDTHWIFFTCGCFFKITSSRFKAFGFCWFAKNNDRASMRNDLRFLLKWMNIIRIVNEFKIDKNHNNALTFLNNRMAS